MRIVPALILLAGALLLMPGAASAAPLALADHAVTTKTLAAEGAGRRGGRLAPQGPQLWPSRRLLHLDLPAYYRPYQYYYWQFYYPYGGPLFY
ncbi:MAG: hypothetical protein R3D52_00075 [Xanthobacteraceae bacterium]